MCDRLVPGGNTGTFLAKADELMSGIGGPVESGDRWSTSAVAVLLREVGDC